MLDHYRNVVWEVGDPASDAATTLAVRAAGHQYARPARTIDLTDGLEPCRPLI